MVLEAVGLKMRKSRRGGGVGALPLWSPACGPPPNWLRQSAEHLGVGRLCPGVGGEGKLSCFVVGGGGWWWSGTGLWSPACGPPPNGLRQSAEHLSVGWVLLGLVKLKMLVEVMAVSISRAFECWHCSVNHFNLAPSISRAFGWWPPVSWCGGGG